MPRYVIRAARALTPLQEIADAAVVIEDGKIAAIGRRDAIEIPKGAKEYDAWQGRSKGAFSGRIGSIIDLWKQAAKAGNRPTKDQVAAAAVAVKEPLWKIDDPYFGKIETYRAAAVTLQKRIARLKKEIS